jgi:hypothetical protein
MSGDGRDDGDDAGAVPEWLGDIDWSDTPGGDGSDDGSSGVTDPEPASQPDEGPAATGSDGGPASTDRIRAALSEVRGEVRKAALVHAAAEAALVATLAAVLLSLATPAALSGAVGLPQVAFGALRSLPVVGPLAPRTLRVSALVAVGLGATAFGAAYLLRLRRPLVEQFEAANPAVWEALRTARDAVGSDHDTAMARRLYADVITTLRDTSSLELVGTRRLVVTVVLVAVVAAAGVQVAVVNPDLGGLLPGGDTAPGVQQPDDDDDLQDGEDILGDAEDVEAGEEVENITVPGTGEGSDDGPTAPGVGAGGGGGSGEFDSQQAGFAGEERIEDAELVREYNLRIREFDAEDGTENDDGT